MSDARHRRMLGVSLGTRSMAEALAALDAIAAKADAVELRLDFFEEPYDLTRLLGATTIPTIVTNRPRREGRRCDALEHERLAVLRQAADLGATFVDVEWDAATPALLDPIKAAGARVLVSRHSFEEMPSDFEDWARLVADLGADVVKIVGMARDPRDVLPVLRVFQAATLPTIAIAMGEAGLPSRVLALRYDTCFLTYATLGTGERVAPGQLPMDEMLQVYGARRLRPSTAIFGIVGGEASVATRLNAWLAAANLDAVAVPFPGVTDVAATIRAFQGLPVAGWLLLNASAQMAALRAVDRAPSDARRAGRVEVIANHSGTLVGERADDIREAFAVLTGRPAPSDVAIGMSSSPIA